MASRASRLFTKSTSFFAAGNPRIVLKRENSTSAVSRTAISSRSSAQTALIAVAIGGIGFAAGIAYNKSAGYDANYSRAFEFSVPKYGNFKQMDTVRDNEDRERHGG